MKYKLIIDYSEKNLSHIIVESWMCDSLDSLKKTLGESLDLMLDDNRIPIEPNLEKLTENLKLYADEKFITDEFERMKRHFTSYMKLVDGANSFTHLEEKIEDRLDDNTSVEVIAVLD